jgi:hypothetical protein
MQKHGKKPQGRQFKSGWGRYVHVSPGLVANAQPFWKSLGKIVRHALAALA